MAKDDIVLITFPFTDLSGPKLIPAVVLADNSLDLTVCFITNKSAGRKKWMFCCPQLQQMGSANPPSLGPLKLPRLTKP